MATYLITGGCGFIGGHLGDLLDRQGHRIRILDNLSTGRIENAPRRAEIIIGDLLDGPKLAKAMQGVDGCFHLAAVASVPACHEDPVGTHGVNQTGALLVFDAARRAGSVPVVYASSAAVYGDAPNGPLSEAMTPCPLSTYGADKLGCEMHAAVMSRQHGVPTLGFRFFNVYGPRQNSSSPYSSVIPIFCDSIRSGKPIVIHGDGGQVRDFIHVSDVVRQLADAIRRPDASPEVFNLCTGTPTAINELARLIAAATGTAPIILHRDARPGDIRQSVGDPSKVRARLGFKLRIGLAEGLRDLVAGSGLFPLARGS